MSQIICQLENASENINGVKFTRNDDGHMVSEEVQEHIAAIFLRIPGYAVLGASDDENDEGGEGEGGEGEQNPPAAPVKPEPEKETTAQRKARLKKEQEEAAAQKNEGSDEQGGEQQPEGEQQNEGGDEVF